MADVLPLPHDRGHLLWTMEDGPSRKLLSSFDRWSAALVGDDDISEPFFQGDGIVKASIIARQDGIIVGCAMVDYVLQVWAPALSISWKAGDGKRVSKDDLIATLSGPSVAVLSMERTLLNILGHLSGIATWTKQWSAVAPKQIACTRKTVWGMLDKWAVHMGGGLTHRLTKHDAVMMKENDFATMVGHGDTNEQRIVAYINDIDPIEIHGFLEIEVRTQKEAMLAAMAWSQKGETEIPFVIMLDNFSPEACKEVSEQLEEQGVRHTIILEASGGITFETLETWRECGLDVISTSALNRGVSPLDISMLVEDH